LRFRRSRFYCVFTYIHGFPFTKFSFPLSSHRLFVLDYVLDLSLPHVYHSDGFSLTHCLTRLGSLPFCLHTRFPYLSCLFSARICLSSTRLVCWVRLFSFAASSLRLTLHVCLTPWFSAFCSFLVCCHGFAFAPRFASHSCRLRSCLDLLASRSLPLVLITFR